LTNCHHTPSDDGAACYDHQNAADLAALASPAFECTPDLFPELIAAAIQRNDIAQWAAANDIVIARPDQPSQGACSCSHLIFAVAPLRSSNSWL
jgi:hypothetical protein